MITIPASIQELVGRRISRISTSWPDRDVIIFDTVAIRDNSRTRYAYDIQGTFDRAWQLTSMVGYTVTAIEPLEEERSGQQKLVIRTSGSNGFGVLYFSLAAEEEGLLMEDGDDWVQENVEEGECPCLLQEGDGYEDVLLTNLSTGRLPPYDGTVQYVVQEDDVDYGISPEVVTNDCPCEE